jgi:hypothetical protein
VEIIAFTPPPGVWLGIDTAGDDNSPGNVITPELASRLYLEGYRWVARYTLPDGRVLSNPTTTGSYRGCWPLSLREQEDILTAGLGIEPIQFGVFGDAAYGREKGEAAAHCAGLYGWPAAVHHHLDIEGGGPIKAGAARVKGYIEAWAGGNTATRSGMYYTDDFGLGARGLWRLKGITSYHRAATDPLPPSKRSAAIEQNHPSRVCGILCDTNTMRPDRMGSCPTLVTTPETASSWLGEAIGALAGTILP